MILPVFRVRVLVPLSTTVVETGVMLPLTAREELMVLVPVPVKEILAKLPEPKDVFIDPGFALLKLIVELPAVKVPELVQFPPTL